MQSRQSSGQRTQAALCREPSIVQCPLCLLHLSGPAQPGRQQGQTSMDRCLGRDAQSVPGFTAGGVERLDQRCMVRPVARQSAFWRHSVDSLGAGGHLCFPHTGAMPGAPPNLFIVVSLSPSSSLKKWGDLVWLPGIPTKGLQLESPEGKHRGA
jgi:hypothetical protein